MFNPLIFNSNANSNVNFSNRNKLNSKNPKEFIGFSEKPRQYLNLENVLIFRNVY